MKAETKTEIYTCPMHPEIKENAPGRCPKCGMNLVEKTPGTESSNNSKTHHSCC